MGGMCAAIKKYVNNSNTFRSYMEMTQFTCDIMYMQHRTHMTSTDVQTNQPGNATLLDFQSNKIQ